MDIRCLLRTRISKPKNALLTCCVTDNVPIDVIKFLESNHVLFLKHNICTCYVFDGCDYPMKAETKASRCDQRNKSKAEIFLFISVEKNQLRF